MDVLRNRDFQRILLIKPSALGDVVHTLPVLAKLRARYPQARIDWLITPENADLVRHHPALSNVVLFPRRQLGRFGRDWAATLGPARLLASLRRPRYELVIDLHGQFRSAVLAVATGARVRIGFDRPVYSENRRSHEVPGHHGWSGAREGAWLAYTHRIPIPTLDVHAVDRYLWLAPMLGLDENPPEMGIHQPAEESSRIAELLESSGLGGRPMAVLVPGTIWETKHWHIEGFAETGRHLSELGYAVVLAGTTRDLPRSRAIVSACPGVLDLCGRTSVGGLVELIRQASICVTNDSGSMHVAVAVGTRVVSVFGPTNPVWIGPYGRPHAVVRADLGCSPCNLRRLRQCPHDHRCIRGVSGQMVIDRIDHVLAQPKRS